jgi:hypothetical protein
MVLLALMALCLAGCIATREQWEQYDREVAAYERNKSNEQRISAEAWSGATGGSYFGSGGILPSAPTKPGMTIVGVRVVKGED